MVGADEKPVNFVHQDEIWREVVKKEWMVTRGWEEEWSYLTDEYRKLQLEMKATSGLPPPPKTDLSALERHPPYPRTSAEFIGWLVTHPEMALERFGKVARPVNTLYKTLGWPIEACP